MRREKGSLLSVPVTEQKITSSMFDSVTRYQKLLLACPKEVQLIINRERLELNQAYENDKDTPEACFIESAIKLLDEREHNLNQVLDNEINKAMTEKLVGVTRKHLTSVSSADSNDESLNFEINENSSKVGSFTSKSLMQNNSTDSDSKGVCFFYQAEDGQHIYLHKVNVRMLLKEYGSLEFAPPIITAKVVEIESITMTENLRSRLRYLQHLPLTCEFQVVELDFSRMVSELTVQQFESDIKKRKVQRIKKARDEKRREKMIEEQENKKLGKYPKATYNLNSVDQFPSYNPEDFLSLSPPKSGTNGDTSVTSQDISDIHDNCDVGSDCSGIAISESYCVPLTSFAQMLKDGPKSFTQVSKDLVKSNIASSPQSHSTVDSDGGECTPAPEYRLSFGDAFQAALDAATTQTSDNQSSKKKKKGKKKQLLFTTSMNRNNF
ncbi:RING finger protein 10 [Caerostris darwini]|uniref:RING finger protein 10 n=1 Tax=Caerostris darwini TaxID=1538125 RepID=A0AAV4WMV3_9ARAC|nr:RING finger protein 10 [Caerostris darwini]